MGPWESMDLGISRNRKQSLCPSKGADCSRGLLFFSIIMRILIPIFQVLQSTNETICKYTAISRLITKH